MPRHLGIRGVAWGRCDVCGREYPLHQLRIQLGILKCPRDVDNLDVMRRANTIAQILQTPEDQPELGVENALQQSEDIFF